MNGTTASNDGNKNTNTKWNRNRNWNSGTGSRDTSTTDMIQGAGKNEHLIAMKWGKKTKDRRRVVRRVVSFPRRMVVLTFLLAVALWPCPANQNRGSLLPLANALPRHAQAATAATRPTASASREPQIDTIPAKTKHHHQPVHHVEIDSFLVRRRFPLRVVLRSVCLLLTLWSGIGCFRTSGVPYAHTVWQIVYGEQQQQLPPGKVYNPTAMDRRIAQMVLASEAEGSVVRTMLPPVGMPSAGPLLALVASITAWVCLVWLLPLWSTAARVLLDYEAYQPNRDSSASERFVLVRRCSPNTSGTARRTKTKNHGLLVLPLQQSSPVKSKTKPKQSSREQPKSKKKKRKSKKKKQRHEKEATGPVSSQACSGFLDANYGHPFETFFEVDHGRIYCDTDTGECVHGGPSLHASPLPDLSSLAEEGGIPDGKRSAATDRYLPYNAVKLATPTLRGALEERLSSPLVVVQLAGKFVSLLEDGIRAIFSLGLTLVQHAWNANASIKSAGELADEVQTNLEKGCPVLIWNRAKQRWLASDAGDLLPGDVFKMAADQGGSDGEDNAANIDGKETNTEKHKHKHEWIVPVDALVLSGQALTNEAILTGESVPQIKTPIDFLEDDDEETERTKLWQEEPATMGTARRLDLHKDRSSILFAGTTVFHTLGGRRNRGGGAVENGPLGQACVDTTDANPGGITCLALRTGTYSSKGNLLEALRGNSATHSGAISNEQSEKDAVRMIVYLSLCAALSCGSLLFRNQARAVKVSPFRRVIQCTRIILVSIPSNLPLALASVARGCSGVLRERADVVCSEPGSLLTAASVDTVVFDKTGTLTADTQSLSKVVSMPGLPESDLNTESFQRFVLAGCHSLVQFQEDGRSSVVGDPLDQAALRYSHWRHNETLGCYVRHGAFNDTVSEDGVSSSSIGSQPTRLWQICSFPFDPSRRLSSAIVLLQRDDSSLQLWKLTKGSPDTMITLMETTLDSNITKSQFRNQTQELEMQGYRSIAIGAENLANSTIARLLFPNGLSIEAEFLAQAKANAEALHRKEVDGVRGLQFCGFCCFEASIRRSSKRVIKELLGGGLNCVMLTGDSVDAALSVARKVEMYKNRKIAVLELLENSTTEKADGLVWRILTLKTKKDGSFKILRHRTRTEKVTVSSVKKYTGSKAKGKFSLAAHGRALEMILCGRPNKVGKMITKQLDAFSVVARATPELKKQVIETLKHDCDKRVMMCGDGVNDVAAIQSADVAASLLTGFGAENIESNIDVDDKRRMKRLSMLNIGSNRATNVAQARKKEANERIRKEVEKYREEIRKQSSSKDTSKKSEFDELKEMISATMRAGRNEQRRAEQLRKGGGDAARILAEERQGQLSAEGDEVHDESLEPPPIKPGEASLVSSFSCLHPSVDGIDAIIRQGIATSASALATQQAIGLHSLMSCFHLATLYRDGFRYGKYMWDVEMFFYQMLETARNRASCTPRPRLPVSVVDRPPTSLFEFGSVFETISQAVVHISCMAVSVRYAKHIERIDIDKGNERIIELKNFHGAQSTKIAKLMDALAKRSLMDTTEGEKNPNPFFQRAPFRPNYETNMVFILSILQSAISAVVSHKGSPFYHGILESRDLCTIAGATLIFVVACITGKLSSLASLLELKPLPSKCSKLVLLGIVSMNIAACVFCRYISDRFLLSTIEEQPSRVKGIVSDEENAEQSNNAAIYEEKLLREETETNWKGLKLLAAIFFYLVVEVLVSSE